MAAQHFHTNPLRQEQTSSCQSIPLSIQIASRTPLPLAMFAGSSDRRTDGQTERHGSCWSNGWVSRVVFVVISLCFHGGWSLLPAEPLLSPLAFHKDVYRALSPIQNQLPHTTQDEWRQPERTLRPLLSGTGSSSFSTLPSYTPEGSLFVCSM